MQKITLLCVAVEQEPTLAELRNMGILHLVPAKPPENADVETTTKNLAQAHSALSALASRKGKDKKENPRESAADLVSRVNSLDHHKRGLFDKLHVLQSERTAIEPFGDFDPETIRHLQQKGISVKLCYAPPRHKMQVPEDATMILLRKNAAGTWFALVRKGEIQTDAGEFPLPAKSLGAIEREISAIEKEILQIEHDLEHLCGAQDVVTEYIEELKSSLEYHKARAGMGSDRSIMYVHGFCPSKLVDKLRKSAGRHGWGLIVQDPSHGDRVPVLIRNPAWIRPIESLFKLIKILPGYNEVDVSVPFLFAMSLFFAMIVGDAGYGLIFLVATLFVRSRMRKAPIEPFALMCIFSVCTIVWGILCGCYFGIARLPAPLRALRLEWLGDSQNMMRLCLLIGVLHLSVAHLWNIIRFINTTQAIAQFGWLCVTWTIYFGAKFLLLGTPLPWLFKPALIIGLAAVVIFMTPPQKLKTEWPNHLLLPVTLASYFADILSYLRLFALGVASLALSEAFNTMAATIGFGNIVRGSVAALILFAGHTLNIVLSVISVLVHAIRLNALEFSMHLGLEWSGGEYTPFARRRHEGAI